MAAPVAADLTAFMTGMGVTLPASVDEDGLLAAATLEFENRTGRKKYQGDATTTAIRYTLPWPQGALIRLTINDVWALTEVRTGYTASGTGKVLEEYTDYLVSPPNPSTIGRPVEGIIFRYAPPTNPGEILITGKLGYASSMPSDVFVAIIHNAAANALIQIAGASGSKSEEKQGDRAIKYGQESGRGTIDRLMSEFDRVVSRYVKVIG
jgi:hypothetical protein